MISVIVPVYNAKHTLPKCLDSILAQKHTDFEVLLVDDGSTDGSAEICDSYAVQDHRIRVFHQANQGVSVARNTGLDHVRGEYVTFADSDDWVEETWLSDFSAVAGNFDVVWQNAVWHYPDGRLFLRKVDVNPELSYKEQVKSLYPRNFLCYIWAALFKTSLIKERNIRFNPLFAYMEDEDFSLNYCQYAQSLSVLPCRNYHYMFPQANSRDYEKPNFSRLLVEIRKKEYVYSILGKNMAKDVCRDSGIKFELMNIFGSKASDEIKRKSLAAMYGIRPLDYSGGGKLALLAFLVNHFPQAVVHKIVQLLFKIK